MATAAFYDTFAAAVALAPLKGRSGTTRRVTGTSGSPDRGKPGCGHDARGSPSFGNALARRLRPDRRTVPRTTPGAYRGRLPAGPALWLSADAPQPRLFRA